MNSVYRTLNAQLTHHMDDKEIGSLNQAPELTGVPLSIKPPPALFKGRKLISSPPPSSLSFFTNKCLTVLINHDCKTSCGLIQDGFFTNWICF